MNTNFCKNRIRNDQKKFFCFGGFCRGVYQKEGIKLTRVRYYL